jgi:phage/plasmid-like protein (TIGR03299 family)
MAHEVESMAWANEVPWHGLGVQVDPSISVDEMLVRAGLNWDVALEPMYIRDGESFTEVKNKRALVRSTDKKILTTASPNWKPLQNRDALEFFREYTEQGGASLETAGSLRGGKIIWALAKISKDFIVRGRANDTVRGYILLSSPHEVGYRIKVRTTATRVVCANTFALAERDAVSYAQSHTQNFNTQAARDSIELAIDQVAQLEREANKLAQLEMSKYDTARFYARLLQPVSDIEQEETHVKTLLESPSVQNKAFRGVWESFENGPGADTETAWGVFQGLTHYIDHRAGGSNSAARLDSAWFGDRSRIKQKAYANLLEMAA